MVTTGLAPKRPARRPKLAKGLARVVLPAQRVRPETLAALKLRAREHGGIGKAIDAAVALLGRNKPRAKV